MFLRVSHASVQSSPARPGSCVPINCVICCMRAHSQWSNYSIIYEGAVKYSEPIKFFEDPRPLQKSHFGDHNVFLLQFQYTKTLANCKKNIYKEVISSSQKLYSLNGPTPDFYTAIWPMGDQLANSGGILQAPLNPLKTCFAGGASVFRWARPPRAPP